MAIVILSLLLSTPSAPGLVCVAPTAEDVELNVGDEWGYRDWEHEA